MTDADLKQMQVEVKKLDQLLSEPEPGLMTWLEALIHQSVKVHSLMHRVLGDLTVSYSYPKQQQGPHL